MWDGLKRFLGTCAEKFVYPSDCTDAQRQAMWDARGDQVDAVGREFVAALKVVHPKCTAYYAHFNLRLPTQEISSGAMVTIQDLEWTV